MRKHNARSKLDGLRWHHRIAVAKSPFRQDRFVDAKGCSRQLSVNTSRLATINLIGRIQGLNAKANGR